MTRRAKGEGSAPVWNGTRHYWQANYTDANGNRKSVYVSTPGPAGSKACREKRDEAADRAKRGDAPLDTRVTVASAFKTYLDVWCGHLKAGSLREYGNMYRLHVHDIIGNKPLNGTNRLTDTDVQRVLTVMAKRGESETYRQSVYDLMKRAIARAKPDAGSPVDDVKRPGRSTKRFHPWSDAEVSTFLDAVQGHRLEAVWNINLILGLRLGEILGLRWDDVDFEASILRVEGQMNRIAREWESVRKGDNDEEYVLPLNDRLVTLLRARKAAQLRERMRAGSRWLGNADDLVFTGERKGTLLGGNFVREKWAEAIATVPGLRYTKLHGGRHYVASYLRESGADYTTIAKALGHRDQGQTAQRVYVHVGQSRANADLLAAANALPLRPLRTAVES